MKGTEPPPVGSLIGDDQPGDVHVIPIGGEEPLHLPARCCWCYPTLDSQSKSVVIHNARDLRDAKERFSGGRRLGPWVVIDMGED